MVKIVNSEQLTSKQVKTYKQIIDMIIKAGGIDSEIAEICAEIDRTYQNGKISWKDNEQLYALINKLF
ncbi:MAG: hypothetical protein J6S85_13695 [Methanobrevibacter sp.]|nr:hypothetical protein [Methanobrevibacter sp.]